MARAGSRSRARPAKAVAATPATTASASGAPQLGRPFVFFHVGDLHLTVPSTGVWAGTGGCRPDPGVTTSGSPTKLPRELQMEADLDAIFADIASVYADSCIDFVYLPGDLAENACAGEYDLLSTVLARYPQLVVRLIPGDHDRARGGLVDFTAFRAGLAAVPNHAHPAPHANCYEIPFTTCPVPPNPCQHLVDQFNFCEVFNTAGGTEVRCIFLDLVSASMTQKVIPGLDFRLGKGQREWFEYELKCAHDKDQRCAVFMHCYPSDMNDGDEKATVAGLIWSYRVKLVEMGHTHYNEICHDGRTQYATARSVGQNEDGPVGFAVSAIDGDVTSWRFKQLQLTWPFVLITSPADRYLATDRLTYVAGTACCPRPLVRVRALVLTDQPRGKLTVEVRVDNGSWLGMQPIPGTCMYERDVEWFAGSKALSVRAKDGRAAGNDYVDIDTIEPVTDEFVKIATPTKQLGSPQFAVGQWHVKGVRGDQLGPNTNGHKW